jgi:hypothetical protein
MWRKLLKMLSPYFQHTSSQVCLSLRLFFYLVGLYVTCRNWCRISNNAERRRLDCALSVDKDHLVQIA